MLKSEYHRMTNTKIHSVWNEMLQRCKNEKDPKYPDYGGRGISVCEEWKRFAPFYEWAKASGYVEGKNRERCSLDRIDNNGNYCPENCRWATAKEQANNRRSNHYITALGETLTIAQWSDKTGIPQTTLWKRIKMGWDAERMVTQEVKSWKRKS